jgi:hypothetical protein
MENRERDRVSQRTSPTEAGELNRHVEEEKGKRENSGTSAEFGQSIGRSENLEGGEMNRNRNQNSDMGNMGNMENESGRRSGQGNYGSSSGRSGSGSMDKNSGVSRDEQSGSRNSGSSGIGDSSEGRH